MRIGQRGTARDGQRGIITEVYTNAVRFLSDTGAHFTLLNAEFTPAGVTPTVKRSIAAAAKALFSGIRPGDGFHYGHKRRHGRIAEAFMRRLVQGQS